MSNNNSKDDKILVSGPVNTIRLEGNVNGVNKVLYLFFDYHLPLHSQTHCDQDKFYDIINYFIDNLKNNDEKISFFFEIRDQIGRSKILNDPNNQPDQNLNNNQYRDYSEAPSRYFDMYIFKASNFFSKYFTYDLKNNIVRSREPYKHVYFNYTDLRWNTVAYKRMITSILNLLNSKNFYNLNVVLREIITLYYLMKENYEFIYETSREKAKEIISNAPKIGKLIDIDNMPVNDINLIMYRYIYKTLYVYENKDIHEKIIGRVNEIKAKYQDMFKLFNNLINLITKQLLDHEDILRKNNYAEYMYKCQTFVHSGLTNREFNKFYFTLIDGIEEIDEYDFFINIELMDCYFLRRFLDKNYSRKNLVYSGGIHCSNYIYFLIKNFDFKMTHYSFLRYDYDTCIEKIKNHCEYEVLIPPDGRLQCSDLTNFPKNFD